MSELIVREEINYPSLDLVLKLRPMYFAHEIGKRIDFTIWSYTKVQRFTENKPPISFLSKKISIVDAEYIQFMGNFGALVRNVDERMIDIFGINTEQNTLDWYEVDGENRVMQILAPPVTGFRDTLRNKRTDIGDAFNLTMQENRALLEQIFGACIQFAAGLSDLPYGELLQD